MDAVSDLLHVVRLNIAEVVGHATVSDRKE